MRWQVKNIIILYIVMIIGSIIYIVVIVMRSKFLTKASHLKVLSGPMMVLNMLLKELKKENGNYYEIH